MRRVNLLVANSERRQSNLIESLVLDACFDQAVVQTTRTAQAVELVKLASCGAFQLIVVAADNLLPGSGLRKPWKSADEALRAIHEIRSRCETPVIAVAVFPESTEALLEAGAACVVRLPYDGEKLKCEVRQALRIADPVEESKPRRGFLDEVVLRVLQRLRSA